MSADFVDWVAEEGGRAYGRVVPSRLEGPFAHPAIEKISFTRFTAVGKRPAMLAGQHMKRATMESGGHAPVFVCDDSDVAKVVPLIGASTFRNAGQVCSSPTRFLVQRKIFDDFVDGLAGVSAV